MRSAKGTSLIETIRTGTAGTIRPRRSGRPLGEIVPFNDYSNVVLDDNNELARASQRDQFSGSLSKAGRSVLKRGMDIVLSASALVFIAPLLACVAIIMKLKDPGPIFFAQNRIGRDGREFKCLKFRTMVVDAQERLDALLAADPAAAREWKNTQKLTDDPRITPLGDFLRRSSLDELPQLFNILKGEMSIVGPRPIVRNEAVRYGDKYGYYLSTRPGLTGLWQISGRSDTTYEQRVELDATYVRDWSVTGDIRIIAMTVPAVLFSKGAR